jgi:hypothetical protein
MSGARYTLVGLLAVVLVAPAVGQEGGFQPPLNSDPIIPIPTGQAGQPGFYTSAEFVIGSSRAVPPSPPRPSLDLSFLTAGGFGSYCATGLPRPAEPSLAAPQLYRQLLAIEVPFRSVVVADNRATIWQR